MRSQRRVNDPVRPRRRAAFIPDFLVACAAAALAMAGTLVLATFTGDTVAGDTGRTLARAFAGFLAIAGVLLFMMAVLWLGEERSNGDHFWAPAFIGTVVGLAEGWMFLAGLDDWLWLPPIFLLLALRPLRRAGARLLRRGAM
jgi:hypothetical protein